MNAAPQYSTLTDTLCPATTLSRSLPCKQPVPDPALDERRRGTARARIEHGDGGKEIADELLSRRVGPAGLETIGPGSKEIPARAAARLGIGRDHRHTGLHQIAPIMDALGIALADEEHDRRGVGRAAVRSEERRVG